MKFGKNPYAKRKNNAKFCVQTHCVNNSAALDFIQKKILKAKEQAEINWENYCIFMDNYIHDELDRRYKEEFEINSGDEEDEDWDGVKRYY